jgi:uncharacterized protein (TIGR03083 family)
MSSPTDSDPRVLERFLRGFCALIPDTDLTVEVPGCPNWTAESLIVHLGTVLHRVAEGLTTQVAPTTTPPTPPSTPNELEAWCANLVEQLLSTLESTDPDSDVWQPFAGPARVGIWRRRLLHESMIHLWDLQRARGETLVVDPVLASDGIDEFLEIALPRVASTPGFIPPTGSLHLHCTDVHGEWWMQFDHTGALTVRREHAKGDAAIRGSAAAILLGLWNRPQPAEWDVPEVIGATEVADAWMRLPGL